VRRAEYRPVSGDPTGRVAADVDALDGKARCVEPVDRR